MTVAGTEQRRLRRRELSRSRSVWATLVALIAMLVFVYVAIEAILAALDKHSMLATPWGMVQWVAAAPEHVSPALFMVVGVVGVAVGCMLIGAGMARGSLARQPLRTTDVATIVNNETLALAIADSVRRDMRLLPGDVEVTVGAKTVILEMKKHRAHVTEADLHAAGEAAVAGLGTDRRLQVHARLMP